MVEKNCISTYNHVEFNPVNPTSGDILIDDIAHALSMMTRANGHFREFYSVARHSINCAYEAKNRGYSVKVQLMCLLHDAAEAYIGDMTRPLKINIPFFSEIEKKYQKIISEKYATLDISQQELQQIKSVDDSFLYFEFLEFHGETLDFNVKPISVDLKSCIKPIKETKMEFLELYNKLSEQYYAM